ncbi:hypothetical protein FYJ43_07870 [Cutibacterium sp. WCA-380-WT-3A]|uniref:Secreted protein n=1 Tax=Cutibacterium porci TaxID=2605781 RepID=A0A7K0J7L2_9ACTN|nr:DUF5719 family protein [Cutibacterium porci]MSS45954.1 hypothetical protein [Cutibacterium porci]
MSDRPRRALTDDEEPEEIPEARAADVTPARRAVDPDDVSARPPAHAARALPEEPDSDSHDDQGDKKGRDKKARYLWKGPVWAVTLAVVAVAISVATSAIPATPRSAPKAQPISSGRTLVCPPSQGKASLAAGSVAGKLQVGTSVGNLADVTAPVVTKLNTSAGYVRSMAGQRRPSGSALSSEAGMTTWVPCIGAATGGAVSVTDPSTSDLVVVNPDTRAATVDVTMLGSTGEIVTAGMRGIRVSPGQTKVLPMSVWDNGTTPVTALVSAREARVVVGARTWANKGRETIAMAPASKTLFLPAVPAKVSTAVLVISNPGTKRLSVSGTALAGRGPFTLDGADEINIDPRSTIQVDLSKALAGEGVGLRLTADEPVIARLFVQGKPGTTDYALVGPGGASKVLEQTVATSGTLELSNPGQEAVTFSGELRGANGNKTAIEGTVPAGSTWSGKVPAAGHLHIVGSAPLIGGVVSSSGVAVLPLEAAATTTSGRRADIDPQLR